MQKKVLGKGLSAILSDLPSSSQQAAAMRPAPAEAHVDVPPDTKPVSFHPEALRSVLELPLDRVDVNPRQPRRFFDADKLAELSNSIAQEGVLQPILVVRRGDRYEIVAGERRFRASKAAGKDSIPAILTEVGERESLKLALVENIQRDDLNPIEEARAFQVMIEEFGWTQEELGRYLGKDRSTISNTLRLLRLPAEAQNLLAHGELSAGHVRTLIRLDRETCVDLARRIARDNLSVRQAERLANARKRGDRSGEAPSPAKQQGNPVIRAITTGIEARIGLPVKLQYQNGRGKLTIPFGSDGELERIMQTFSVSLDGDS